jgi:hypothetical protein
MTFPANLPTPSDFPRRIVCLSDETTETLYLLGEQDRIVGVSGFTRSSAGSATETAHLRVQQRQHRWHPRTEAGPRPDFFRRAGRHHAGTRAARPHRAQLQPAQHPRNSRHDRHALAAGRKSAEGLALIEGLLADSTPSKPPLKPSRAALACFSRSGKIRSSAELLGGGADRDRRRRGDFPNCAAAASPKTASSIPRPSQPATPKSSLPHGAE